MTEPMLFAVVVLGALLGSAVLSWRRPTRGAAFLLAACCALWFPANNGHLEGPTLITVDPQHGLSTADLLAYGGFVLAIVTVVRWWHAEVQRRQRCAPPNSAAASADYFRVAAALAIVGLFGVLGAGLLFDWVHQPG